MRDEWLSEDCEVEPGAETPLKDLFASWVSYADKRHLPPKRNRDLAAWLVGKGYRKYRASRGMMIEGIVVKAAASSAQVKPFFKTLEPKTAEEWIVARCELSPGVVTPAKELYDDLYLWTGRIYEDQVVEEWLQECKFPKVGDCFRNVRLNAMVRMYHKEAYSRWFRDRCAMTDVNDRPPTARDLAMSFQEWDTQCLERYANSITMGVWLKRQKLPYVFRRQTYRGSVYHGIRLKKRIPMAGWI